jgi:nitrate reductase delta subunit
MSTKSTRTYKALSALLTYPTAELQEAADEIDAVLHDEELIAEPLLRPLDRLVEEIRSGELYDLQERYVMIFDRSRSFSLHLFEHIHGESRDRGQAMVDLAQHYDAGGFEIATNELPDFLPLFLEFLSQIGPEEAHELLQQPLAIIAALADRLGERRSAYAAVFAALVDIAGGKGIPVELGTAADDDPLDFEALDRAWEEAAVSFGPGDWGNGDGACDKSRLTTRIRAATRSVDAPASPPHKPV